MTIPEAITYLVARLYPDAQQELLEYAQFLLAEQRAAQAPAPVARD